MLLVTLLASLALALGFILRRSLVFVGGNELAVLERRWFGRRMARGRVIAVGAEVGVQARVLTPGVHPVTPFVYTARRGPLVHVSDDEVGLVESIDGEAVPAGRIFARVVSGHDHFQDGEAFLRLGGERGPQLQVLPPGVYRINPRLFSVSLRRVVDIPSGKIGRVSASDGARSPVAACSPPACPGTSIFRTAARSSRRAARKARRSTCSCRGATASILGFSRWRCAPRP